MICSECGTVNDRSAHFCGQCGRALPQTRAPVRDKRLWFWLLFIGVASLVLTAGLVVAGTVIWLRPVTQPVALAPPPQNGPLAEQAPSATAETRATPKVAAITPTPAATGIPLPTKTPTALPTPATLPSPTASATALPEVTAVAGSLSVAIEISATEPQFATNLFLSQGQQVTIEYLSGSWRTGAASVWPLVGPRGDLQVASKSTFPVPNAPLMTLIAGVGNERPFAIYEQLTFTAVTSGQLWLAANDDIYEDNAGSLTVRITVSSPGSAPASPDGPILVTTAVAAHRRPQPPTIDGFLDEWTSFPAYHSAHRVYAHSSWNGRETLQAFWYLAWDDDHLYVAATVVDDVHVQTQPGNLAYRGDSLELQIDTNVAAGLDYLTPAVYQILLSPGDFEALPPSAFRFRGNDQRQIRDAPGHAIRVAARKTLNGYTLEAAIPWRDLGVTPYAGLVLGLALNANDNDTPGAAVQEVMVSNVPGRMLTNPATWGTITLTP
jgi:hypothetical protein